MGVVEEESSEDSGDSLAGYTAVSYGSSFGGDLEGGNSGEETPTETNENASTIDEMVFSASTKRKATVLLSHASKKRKQ
jgi:hypothetical protein